MAFPLSELRLYKDGAYRSAKMLGSWGKKTPSESPILHWVRWFSKDFPMDFPMHFPSKKKHVSLQKSRIYSPQRGLEPGPKGRQPWLSSWRRRILGFWMARFDIGDGWRWIGSLGVFGMVLGLPLVWMFIIADDWTMGKRYEKPSNHFSCWCQCFWWLKSNPQNVEIIWNCVIYLWFMVGVYDVWCWVLPTQNGELIHKNVDLTIPIPIGNTPIIKRNGKSQVGMGQSWVDVVFPDRSLNRI